MSEIPSPGQLHPVEKGSHMESKNSPVGIMNLLVNLGILAVLILIYQRPPPNNRGPTIGEFRSNLTTEMRKALADEVPVVFIRGGSQD